MKTIGLLGGMSWESTASYYELINRGVQERLGGLHSAKICMQSLDFHDLEQLQHRGDWDQIADILAASARKLERAGADILMLCTNTMHKVADQLEAAIDLPFLHIADATGSELVRDGVRLVGLLGTRFTMEEEFYKARLLERFDIDVIVPDPEQRELVHRVIYEELCRGEISDESRTRFLDILNHLYARGAKSTILGCTEIGLLVDQTYTAINLYDTTALHCRAAVDMALADTDNNN